MSHVTYCTNCGCTDIEYDQQRGDAACINCGTVLEENTIVNEVTFSQDAGGGSSVVGQFVASTPGLQSSGLGFGKESREVAFSNGQRHIAQLAGALRLADHHQEAAQRLFMHAVHNNFIQGRRTQHVIAACLYAVCRREKTPHLLIDYSDVLQTNVYTLGSCFLKFVRLLSLTLPIIDPSLFIHRFASKLEFGDKTHLVSMSALRLVQQMKRDWIQTGRRPSGICGAALLIAARVHGFFRTQREVVRVVRICEVTLRKRLTEFCETPLGKLTAHELETCTLESFVPADPPCFTRAREAEAARQLRLTTPGEAERQDKQAELQGLKVLELRDQLSELGGATQGRKRELIERIVDMTRPEPTETPSLEFRVPADPLAPLEAEMQRALHTEPILRHAGGAAEDYIDGETPVMGEDFEADKDATPGYSAWLRHDNLLSREEEMDEETREEMLEEMNADLEQLDDEVEGYLIKDNEEVQMKTRVWEEMNREYLEKQAAKAEEERLAAERAEQEGEEGHLGRPKQKKRGRKGEAKGSAEDGADPRKKRISSRINYDVAAILTQQALEEDAALMPDAPGPLGLGFQGNADAFSETLSVHSSMGHGTDDDPAY